MQDRRLGVATGLSPHGRSVAQAATAFALLIALAALGGCASTPSAAPTQSGSMAYPAPAAQGNLRTTDPDAQSLKLRGAMAYPAPRAQGNLATTPTGGQTSDEGSMAYPAPAPQGDVATTPTSGHVR
jgi:hypothetical protein